VVVFSLQLVLPVAGQHHFVHILTSITLLLSRCGVLHEQSPLLCQFIHEGIPKFILLGGRTSEVDAVGIVIAGGLGDSSIDLALGD